MAASKAQAPPKKRGPGRKFKPGESGNPKGRAPDIKVAEVRKLISSATEGGQKIIDTIMEIMNFGQKESVRLAAANALANRLWGREPHMHEVSGLDGEPIKLQHEVDVSKLDSNDIAYMIELHEKTKPERDGDQ